MTDHPNAALVRRGYEAFNAADMATLTELFDEQADLYQPGSNPIAGEYRGRDAVFAFFGELAQRSRGTFRAEIRHLYASDRDVVAIHHATATRDGAVLDTETALVFAIEDGRVTGMRAVQRDQEEWDAFFTP
jgi:uncharacterized protein